MIKVTKYKQKQDKHFFGNVMPITFTKWHNCMEMLSASLAFVRGIHRSPMDFPHKGPVMRGFDIFFAITTKNFCTNSQVAG